MNQYKPELGRFYGDSNPEVWVFQAERYFNFYGFSKDSWLSMPYVYFKGEARAWFDWLYRNDQFYDWDHFTKKLAMHYHNWTFAEPMRHGFSLSHVVYARPTCSSQPSAFMSASETHMEVEDVAKNDSVKTAQVFGKMSHTFSADKCDLEKANDGAKVAGLSHSCCSKVLDSRKSDTEFLTSEMESALEDTKSAQANDMKLEQELVAYKLVEDQIVTTDSSIVAMEQNLEDTNDGNPVDIFEAPAIAVGDTVPNVDWLEDLSTVSIPISIESEFKFLDSVLDAMSPKESFAIFLGLSRIILRLQQAIGSHNCHWVDTGQERHVPIFLLGQLVELASAEHLVDSLPIENYMLERPTRYVNANFFSRFSTRWETALETFEGMLLAANFMEPDTVDTLVIAQCVLNHFPFDPGASMFLVSPGGLTLLTCVWDLGISMSIVPKFAGVNQVSNIMATSGITKTFVKAYCVLASRQLADSSTINFPFVPGAPTSLVFWDMSESLKLVIWDTKTDQEAPSTEKKAHIVWSLELHTQFLAAVNQLCIDREVSLRVLDLISVELAGTYGSNITMDFQRHANRNVAILTVITITFPVHLILHYFPFDPGANHFLVTSGGTLPVPYVWNLPFIMHNLFACQEFSIMHNLVRPLDTIYPFDPGQVNIAYTRVTSVVLEIVDLAGDFVKALTVKPGYNCVQIILESGSTIANSAYRFMRVVSALHIVSLMEIIHLIELTELATREIVFPWRRGLLVQSLARTYLVVLFKNHADFSDQATVTVGAGNNILPLSVSQDSARLVSAIEASVMIDHARNMFVGSLTPNERDIFIQVKAKLVKVTLIAAAHFRFKVLSGAIILPYKVTLSMHQCVAIVGECRVLDNEHLYAICFSTFLIAQMRTKEVDDLVGVYAYQIMAAKDDTKDKSAADPITSMMSYLMQFSCAAEALPGGGVFKNMAAIVYEFIFYLKLEDCGCILGLHLVVGMQMSCYKRVNRGHAWWLFLLELKIQALASMQYAGNYSNSSSHKALLNYLESVWMLGLRGLNNSKDLYFMNPLLIRLPPTSILEKHFLRVAHNYEVLHLYSCWPYNSFSFVEPNLEDKVLIESGSIVMNGPDGSYKVEVLGPETGLHMGQGIKESNKRKEFRLSINILRTIISNDIYEGIRAVIIDKDNSPKWYPPTLEKVKNEQLDLIFKSFEEHNFELQIPDKEECRWNGKYEDSIYYNQLDLKKNQKRSQSTAPGASRIQSSL